MEPTFIVLLWGVAGSQVEGPFGDADSATSWLIDHSFDDDRDNEGGMVLGPIPVIASRIE